MLNIVEKYTVDTTPDTDEGVVAIEYVVVAAAVVAALGAIWTAFGDDLSAELSSIVDSIS